MMITSNDYNIVDEDGEMIKERYRVEYKRDKKFGKNKHNKFFLRQSMFISNI